MRALFSLLICFSIFTPARADVVPEPESGWTEKQAVEAKQYMAVTAHPLASRAAAEMLAKGGSAVDAAIAAQAVLGVVEPQASGIGGGGFLLFYNGSDQSIKAYDGREVAPAAATAKMFLDEAGAPLDFIDAVRSGNAVGVPGLLAMLKQVHDAHGKLPWKSLFAPAITTAENGFAITPRLQKSIAYAATQPLSDEFKNLYLQADGAAKRTGQVLKNQALAHVLKRVAEEGPKAFYEGEIAADIAKAAKAHGGTLSVADLKAYTPKSGEAVCGDYREYQLCGMGLPSSGMLTILQTLGIISHLPYEKAEGAQKLHLVLEAEKRAFADRNRYLADAAMAWVPAETRYLAPDYLKKRAASIRTDKASVTPAKPGKFKQLPAKDHSVDLPSTSHMSIVDADGNAVSFTSSVEHSFGSGIVVHGFILNNQLTDFSFVAEENGKAVANAAAPGKRPRSSMSPTLILHPDRQLFAVVGSPGGSSIIAYVRSAIMGLIDGKLPAQDAVNLKHAMHKNDVVRLEEGQDKLAEELRKMGHTVQLGAETSGLHVIVKQADGSLVGAADPRREGLAMGH